MKKWEWTFIICWFTAGFSAITMTFMPNWWSEGLAVWIPFVLVYWWMSKLNKI